MSLKREEFACKGKDCCGGQLVLDSIFFATLSRARVMADVPFVINSGYRCLQNITREFTSNLRYVAAFTRAILSASINFPFACSKNNGTRLADDFHGSAFWPMSFNRKDMIFMHPFVALWANSDKVVRRMVWRVNSVYPTISTILMMDMKSFGGITPHASMPVSFKNFITKIVWYATCNFADCFPQKVSFPKPKTGWILYFRLPHFLSRFVSNHIRLLSIVHNNINPEVCQ